MTSRRNSPDASQTAEPTKARRGSDLPRARRKMDGEKVNG